MPREYVHWEILYASLIDIPQAQALLKQEWNLMALSALTPDAPYFHRFGRSNFSEIGEAIHGADGEDTYVPVRRILKDAAISIEIRQAIALGYLSHCIVDAVFHPLIYSVTGNYYDDNPLERRKSQTRHRALETYLDEYWEKTFPFDRGDTRFHVLVKEQKNNNAVLYKTLSRSFEQTSELLWQQSFEDMNFVISCALSTMFGFVAQNVNRMLGNKFDAELALSRYGRNHAPAWMLSPIVYLDPVTGESLSVDWINLRISAIKMIQELVKGIFETPHPEAFLDAVCGASLNSGKIGSKKRELKYYNVQHI